MESRNKKTVFLYLAPAIIISVIFLYLPIIINLFESFYSWGALSPKKSFVGLDNYVRMFKDKVFLVAVKNNLLFVIGSVTCQIGISLIIASVLEAKFMRKTQRFFQTVYFIPSLLMATVVGITFKMIYSPSLGIVNPMLKSLGVDTSHIDLLGNASSATLSIVGMSQWQYIGYTVILFLVAIQNISEDLYEAASIDGASPLKKFLYITLPQLKDTILINTIITVTGSIREYDEVFVTTNGGPGSSTETLATYLYKAGFKNDQMGYASAIAFFIFIITFLIGLLQMRSYHMEDNN
ncbi:MAG: sugar ABC transporter permease [Herbinix sp.]|nr:sugar ABC transporter permease [Herbinix sp.]